jgi:hypothetical protein
MEISRDAAEASEQRRELASNLMMMYDEMFWGEQDEPLMKLCWLMKVVIANPGFEARK